MRITILFVAIALSSIVLFACVSQKTVERTSADTVTDLSGRWNDTDSRLVVEAMMSDMISRPWLENFVAENSRSPVIIAGYVKNRSSEHIEVSGIIADIERELINSGKASIVANSGQRQQIREERGEQQDEASFDTIKRLGEETGADYMLVGKIISQTDAARNTTTKKRKGLLSRLLTAKDTTAVVYQIDMELIDIENTQKVWIGSKKIKKIIERQ